MLLGMPSVSSIMVGEGVDSRSVDVGRGSWTRGVVEVNTPAGLLRETGEERGSSGTVGEGLTTGMEETTLEGGGRDWVGRLTPESVEVKKMVETTVTVTRLPAAGFVGCGMPSVEFPLLSPGDVEEGSAGRIVEDGVVRGSTAVGVPGMPLERVTSGLSNWASLRGERPKRPFPTMPRAHQIPTSTCQPM